MEESVHKSVAGSIVGFRLLLWGVVQGNANFANGANCSNLGCFFFIFCRSEGGVGGRGSNYGHKRQHEPEWPFWGGSQLVHEAIPGLNLGGDQMSLFCQLSTCQSVNFSNCQSVYIQPS